MSLSNEDRQEHMDELLGSARVGQLRRKIENMAPKERELTVIEDFSQALKAVGGQYVLPFRFLSKSGQRTSHHLVFVSKHPLGYEIMKGIMAKESTQTDQGVPSFEYNPADRKYPLLFELTRPLDDLKEMLLAAFAGRTVTMDEVYRKHNEGTRFIKSNYKQVLVELEREGRIRCNPPATERPRRKEVPTFPDRVSISFPERKV